MKQEIVCFQKYVWSWSFILTGDIDRTAFLKLEQGSSGKKCLLAVVVWEWKFFGKSCKRSTWSVNLHYLRTKKVIFHPKSVWLCTTLESSQRGSCNKNQGSYQCGCGSRTHYEKARNDDYDFFLEKRRLLGDSLEFHECDDHSTACDVLLHLLLPQHAWKWIFLWDNISSRIRNGK